MALPDGAPAKSALVDEWVEYAMGRGVASYEARNMTKDDLIARLEAEDVTVNGSVTVTGTVTVNGQDLGPAHGVGSYGPDAQPAVTPEPKPAPRKGRTNG